MIAYLIPLVLAAIALVLAVFHLIRGRIGLLVAWLPVVGSLIVVSWLVAYLYFGAFRGG
jgi:hypothetical protein